MALPAGCRPKLTVGHDHDLVSNDQMHLDLLFRQPILR